MDEQETAETRRRRLQQQVVMPEGDDDMPLRVDGTKEYRRNALALLVFGLILTLGSVATLLASGSFYYVIFGMGVLSVFLGVVRFFTGGVNG